MLHNFRCRKICYMVCYMVCWIVNKSWLLSSCFLFLHCFLCCRSILAVKNENIQIHVSENSKSSYLRTKLYNILFLKLPLIVPIFNLLTHSYKTSAPVKLISSRTMQNTQDLVRVWIISGLTVLAFRQGGSKAFTCLLMETVLDLGGAGWGNCPLPLHDENLAWRPLFAKRAHLIPTLNALNSNHFELNAGKPIKF